MGAIYQQMSDADVADIRTVVFEPNDSPDVSHDAFSQTIVEPSIGNGTQDVVHVTRVASVAASVCPDGACTDLGFEQFADAFRSRLRAVSTLRADAFAANPDVMNYSFVDQDVPGLFAQTDDRAIFLDRFVLTRGSNNGDVTANCFEYNGICVGGYDGHGTFGIPEPNGETQFQFADDTPKEAYRNLPLDGTTVGGPAREEPDLVAKSEHVIAAFPGGGEHSWNDDHGTSFAAPAVAGLAALITNVVPSLDHEPTAMRALLMASAHHNVADTVVPIFSDDIDDRDGAGAPRGDEALKILGTLVPGSGIEYGILDRDLDFDVSGEHRTTFEATAGQVARVALTWDVCPYSIAMPAGQQFDFLTIDLDMVVEGPPTGGTLTLLKSNPSSVDNYEIIEFLVPKSGTWTISVQAPRWSGCADLDPQATGARRTYYGLAWDVRDVFAP